MKFPRNAKIFRGHLDVAPFAGVFFCLAIFLLVLPLVYPPGVAIQLPVSRTELPGVPVVESVTVAMDANNQYYFENQIINESNLLARLQEKVRQATQPLTLIMQLDERAKRTRLIDLAKAAGITHAVDEMLPPMDAPAAAGNPTKK